MDNFVEISDKPEPGSYAEKIHRRAESLAGRQAAMKLAVSEELWGALERTGTSQAELARRVGTSPQYITKVFRGTTNFTLESMVALFYHSGYELEFSARPKVGVVTNALPFRHLQDYSTLAKSYQPTAPNGISGEWCYDPAIAAEA